MAQTLQRRGSLVSDLPSRAPQNFVTNWGQHVNTYLQTAQMAKQLETEVKLNNLKTRARDLEIQVREQQLSDMERGNSYMHENASRWTMALSGMGDYELIQEIDAEVLRLNNPQVTQQWGAVRGPWGKAEYRKEGEEKPVSNAARMRKSLAVAAGAVIAPERTLEEQAELKGELAGIAATAQAAAEQGRPLTVAETIATANALSKQKTAEAATIRAQRPVTIPGTGPVQVRSQAFKEKMAKRTRIADDIVATFAEETAAKTKADKEVVQSKRFGLVRQLRDADRELNELEKEPIIPITGTSLPVGGADTPSAFEMTNRDDFIAEFTTEQGREPTDSEIARARGKFWQ